MGMNQNPDNLVRKSIGIHEEMESKSFEDTDMVKENLNESKAGFRLACRSPHCHFIA